MFQETHFEKSVNKKMKEGKAGGMIIHRRQKLNKGSYHRTEKRGRRSFRRIEEIKCTVMKLKDAYSLEEKL